jgi:hypothetical protein
MNVDKLTICLRSIVDSLDFGQDKQLSCDISSIREYLESPYFRVAVFGPFNHGKSTLLNALLGTRALPIDIIPTTGAVISIKHGVELSTSINLRDGNKVSESGTDLLRRFAILDGDRRMRDDVISVEMFCPHPLLERAVEILDLPGTNDREEQDALVRSELLKADLVIQVLDARKLMTLGEREGLRDWLIDRGIETVVFVINFLNLLEQQEQQEVWNRGRYVAESFRANLPPGISNMYRVDALPALRAKLKGDTAEAHSSGIFVFESAIQSIVETWSSSTIQDFRFPRAASVISQVKQTLHARIQTAQTELQIASDRHSQIVRSGKQSERAIKQSFKSSTGSLREWLSIQNLLSRYQTEVASALEKGNFRDWENGVFKQTLVGYKREIVKWVTQGSTTFNRTKPDDLYISFPADPDINLPEQPSEQAGDAGSVVGTGAVWGTVGFFLGGPIGAAIGTAIGAAASHGSNEEAKEAWNKYYSNRSQAYKNAASDYLERFSIQALTKLEQYEREAEKIISFQQPHEPHEVFLKRGQLEILQGLLSDLVSAEPVSDPSSQFMKS